MVARPRPRRALTRTHPHEFDMTSFSTAMESCPEYTKMNAERRAYIDALLAPESPAAYPPAPKLIRVNVANDMVRAAVVASSIELVACRRALLASGTARKTYNEAVRRVSLSLEAAGTVTRLTKEAAAAAKKASDAESPAALSEELANIEKDLKKSTDATVRADLIRRLHDRRRRLDVARRARDWRPVTDLLLDARSGARIKILGIVANGSPLPDDRTDGDPPQAEPERDHRYHRGPDPLRWYD